jgi:hypothetical protein
MKETQRSKPPANLLRKTLILFAVLFVALFAAILLQPSDFKITRSITIAAPPSAIFPQVNDLHSWQEWSPWAKLDPKAKITFAGPAAGTGAAFHWAGNDDVGEGTMTIIESQPDNLVRFNLEFVKPLAGTNVAEFTFKPEGAQTLVTWSMSGKNGFIGKAVSLVINCDKIVGKQFAKGLADLKSITEAKTKP